MTEPVTLKVEDASLRFEAAHFLVYGDGRCDPPHGHSFRMTVQVEGTPDADGLVIDFLHLLRAAKALCDAWDHRLLLPGNNADLAIDVSDAFVTANHRPSGRALKLLPADVIALPLRTISAETLAEHAAHHIHTALALAHDLGNLSALAVRIEEGPGYSAVFRLVL